MAPHTITITIRRLADLFVDAPDENPLLPEWEAFAGLDRVSRYLTTRNVNRGVDVTIQIPDTLVLPPDVMTVLHDAINRYCNARIAENQRERAFKIQTGITGLAYSLVISFLIAVVLTTLVGQLPLPEWLDSVLSSLFTIGAWAILWGPLEAIFYDWLPNWTAIRVYRTIMKGTFRFQPIAMRPAEPMFQ